MCVRDCSAGSTTTLSSYTALDLRLIPKVPKRACAVGEPLVKLPDPMQPSLKEVNAFNQLWMQPSSAVVKVAISICSGIQPF
jgi:hypothetical protein